MRLRHRYAALDQLGLLSTHDWEFTSEAILRALLGWENEHVARMAALTLRESVHPAQFVALMQQMRTWDVHGTACIRPDGVADGGRACGKPTGLRYEPQRDPRLAWLLGRSEPGASFRMTSSASSASLT